MKRMWARAWYGWAAALAWLAGCAAPAVQPDASVFEDRLFAPPSVPIGADGLFSASPEMRRYVAERITPAIRHRDAHEVLLEQLYERGMLRLEYDAEYTRNAHEAFEARMGNCLSLVIMTAAFAREVGLQVRFQEVPQVTTWDRAGDLVFAVGHVNLVLGPGTGGGRWSASNGQRWLIVDFLPGQDLGRQRARTIGEERIRAMFMNNRAAEALKRGELDNAYWWARGAFAADASYANTFNTLGVVYRRHGHVAAAERALRQALALDADHVHALGNLAALLEHTGRGAEAVALRAALKKREAVQPFELYAQGMQALREGDWRRARTLFERGLEEVNDNHEFHFGLAVAHLQLGDAARAREHLQRALENSSTRLQRSVYARKLEGLKALVVQ